MIAFYGDSITSVDYSPIGYAHILAKKLPDTVNFGVMSETTSTLLKHWDRDCIELKPKIASILIGINEFHHDDQDFERFKKNYRQLIETAPKETKLVLCQPFLTFARPRVIPRGDFTPYPEYVKALAEEFNCILVPLHDLLANPIPQYYAADGIHPTPIGHSYIAECWLNATHKLLKSLNN